MYLSNLAVAVLDQDGLSGDYTRLLTIFVGLVALAMVTQAVVVIFMAVGAAKAQKKVMGQIDEIKEKLLPVLTKSNGLLTDLTPQINQIAVHARSIAGNVENVSSLVKEKLNEFGPTISDANEMLREANMTVRETLREANSTVREANRKTQAQVSRVDGMVSSVLDATASAARSIQNGITMPVREVSGLVEGLKAGLMTFVNGGRRNR